MVSSILPYILNSVPIYQLLDTHISGLFFFLRQNFTSSQKDRHFYEQTVTRLCLKKNYLKQPIHPRLITYSIAAYGALSSIFYTAPF